ncbi:MAG: hypothetical protein NT040_17575 [Bacteroidetes bacterium]|nr:hypothetical protein [Bacteroidota bacterium]
MKSKTKHATTIVTTLILSLVITAVFAQKPYKPGHPEKANQEQALTPPDAPPPPPPPPIGDIPPAAPPALDLPDLTDVQLEKIKQAGLDHMKIMTPMHNQVREKKARLQTILTTTPFEIKLSDQVAEELGKIETGILKEMIRHDQELRTLLTPAQQVIFDARPKPFLRRK